jgi:hypothetical protein
LAESESLITSTFDDLFVSFFDPADEILEAEDELLKNMLIFVFYFCKSNLEDDEEEKLDDDELEEWRLARFRGLTDNLRSSIR